MDFIAELIDTVKAALRTGIDAGRVVAVIRKLFAWGKARAFADDFVAFDDEGIAVVVVDDPFPTEKCDDAIGGIADGDKIDECVRFIER